MFYVGATFICLLVCDLVSVTLLVFGFLWNSALQLFTQDCRASVNFMKIGLVTLIFYLTLNIPRGSSEDPRGWFFCDPAVTISTNLLLIFVCVPHQLPGGARNSAPIQTGPEAHPASCKMITGSFPGVRCCRGVTLTPHPLLVQRSKI